MLNPLVNKYRQSGWRKMKAWQVAAVEELLKIQERVCVNACSRFINRDSLKSQTWVLHGIDNKPCALVIYSRQTLLPVLCRQESIPPPRFLNDIFGTVPIHSLQGKKADVTLFEAELEKIGLFTVQCIDYDLMCLDSEPSCFQNATFEELIVRKPIPEDMDNFAALHAEYEQEEVVLSASDFMPLASRITAERTFANKQVLVAELGGRLVGKINTNATAFTCCQIGGVYVHPHYRNLGIARKMVGKFTTNLIAQGLGISLFVKKTNATARRVYQRIGFTLAGDYRISYY